MSQRIPLMEGQEAQTLLSTPPLPSSLSPDTGLKIPAPLGSWISLTESRGRRGLLKVILTSLSSS